MELRNVKILRNVGYWILTVLASIFVALGAFIVDLQLKPYIITMIIVIMGATETLLYAIIRIVFNIPEEEG